MLATIQVQRTYSSSMAHGILAVARLLMRGNGARRGALTRTLIRSL